MRLPTVLPLLCAVLVAGCSSYEERTIAATTPSSTPTLSRPDQEAALRAAVAASRLASLAPSPTVTRSPSAAPRATAAAPTTSPTRSAARRYVSPIRGCSASYGHSHHDYPATDIFAARGCRVVSPVTGVVDEVSTVDRWDSSTNDGATRGGLSFSVVGVDGVRYYGSHLQTLLVHAGQHVVAGQKVGTVGTTGSARGTAPHLHFGISWPTRHGVWWVRRGEVYPWPYLDSWRAGGTRSPASAVAARHRQEGDVPPCDAAC